VVIEVTLFLTANGALIVAMTVAGTDVALLCGNWRYPRQWRGDTPIVNDIGNEAGEANETLAGGQVFPDNFDEDLERAGPGAGDVGRQDHGVIEMKGLEKADVVKRGRHNGLMR